jgi:hypothetical protein
MSVALKLYEQLTDAGDDRERFRLIADAIGTLEDAWPRPGEVARAGDVREAELRLQKEIETVRKEIAETEGRLRKELAEVEGRLRMEIEGVRKETELVQLETERVRGEIRASETRLQQSLHRQTFWIIGAVGAVVGLIRLLDAMLP